MSTLSALEKKVEAASERATLSSTVLICWFYTGILSLTVKLFHYCSVRGSSSLFTWREPEACAGRERKPQRLLWDHWQSKRSSWGHNITMGWKWVRKHSAKEAAIMGKFNYCTLCKMAEEINLVSYTLKKKRFSFIILQAIVHDGWLLAYQQDRKIMVLL